MGALRNAALALDLAAVAVALAVAVGLVALFLETSGRDPAGDVALALTVGLLLAIPAAELGARAGRRLTRRFSGNKDG